MLCYFWIGVRRHQRNASSMVSSAWWARGRESCDWQASGGWVACLIAENMGHRPLDCRKAAICHCSHLMGFYSLDDAGQGPSGQCVQLQNGAHTCFLELQCGFKSRPTWHVGNWGQSQGQWPLFNVRASLTSYWEHWHSVGQGAVNVRNPSDSSSGYLCFQS